MASASTPLRPGLIGGAATFSGIGLARFAYTPLIPAMAETGWFTAAEAAYLGAANLIGYLLGAVAANRLAARFGTAATARVSLLLVAASFLLCALPAPFPWFALWRLLSGVAGAVLMVAGVSAAIGAVPPERRGPTAARVFTGIGLGVLLSAVVVPLLLRISLTTAWLTLGACAVLACWVGWAGWGRLSGQAPEAPAEAPAGGRELLALSAATLSAYALDAVGFIPHTVFWVDFLARGRGLGIDAAGLQWALFGLGAVSGPMLAARVAARLGWRGALIAVLATKTAVVALPLLTPGAWLLGASSLVMGALVPATVAITSARMAEIAGPAAHRRVWGWATATFALSQAGTGYLFALLFDHSDSYLLLFALAATALAIATALAAFNPIPRRRGQPPRR
ncbi:YbfB/YjiJ family MFS transporter [Arhodomonas sp. SL1]|uniref:YbfB/YjiJ family MFS transporter n=1 Tax=Arhodomonas sp. SL1 TaxID=3425691 RepID=UPI003F882D68